MKLSILALVLAAGFFVPAASAFETTGASPNGVDGLGHTDAANETSGQTAEGLQVFGTTGPYSLRPNYIPHPPPSSELPGWFYSTPAFRASR